MPQLRISNYYRQRLASGNATPEEKEFIKRKVNAAQWLIESIEQRRSTLTKVSQAIIDHQIRFVEEGPEAIEPLKMQQIADKVGVHVTTVSRAVDDKWIQTPRGIFALRNFFVGGTKAADGEDVAWDAIRASCKRSWTTKTKQALQRRRSCQATRNQRSQGGAPHRHQIPQENGHPQLTPTPRLDKDGSGLDLISVVSAFACRQAPRHVPPAARPSI